MRKVNTNELAEETWASPNDLFRGLGLTISYGFEETLS